MNGYKKLAPEVYQTPRPPAAGTQQRVLYGKRIARVFDWAGISTADLFQLVSRVAGNGDLCCVGLTSDGGAISITVVSNNTRFKTYAKDGNEFGERVGDLLEELYQVELRPPP